MEGWGSAGWQSLPFSLLEKPPQSLQDVRGAEVAPRGVVAVL